MQDIVDTPMLAWAWWQTALLIGLIVLIIIYFQLRKRQM
jgi:hypothetical protein